MTQAKTTKLPADNVFVQAAKGKLQPILYKGSIIFIGEDKRTELDLNSLSYQSRAQLDRAIKEGDLLKVKGE